jgi:uncharacterized membrane protein
MERALGKAFGFSLLAFILAFAIGTVRIGGPLQLFVGMGLIGVMLAALAAAGVTFVAVVITTVAERQSRRRDL